MRKQDMRFGQLWMKKLICPIATFSHTHRTWPQILSPKTDACGPLIISFTIEKRNELFFLHAVLRVHSVATILGLTSWKKMILKIKRKEIVSREKKKPANLSYIFELFVCNFFSTRPWLGRQNLLILRNLVC